MQYSKIYNSVMKSLHWLMALAFVGMYAIAYVMQAMPDSAQKFQLYGLHKATGLTLLGLVVFRFIYRQIYGIPPINHQAPLWRLAASLGHYALYGAMVLLPLSGYLMSCAAGRLISYYGFFQVPLILTKNTTLAQFFHESHTVLSYGVYGLLSVHVIMALIHHFILKDDTLTRILPKR